MLPLFILIPIIGIVVVIIIVIVIVATKKKSTNTTTTLRPIITTTRSPATTTPPIIPVYGQNLQMNLHEYQTNHYINLSIATNPPTLVQDVNPPGTFNLVQVTNINCNNYLASINGIIYGLEAPSGIGNPVYLTSINPTSSGWYFSFSQAPPNPLDHTDTSLLYLNVVNNSGVSYYVITGNNNNFVYDTIPQATGSENSYYPYKDTTLTTKWTLSCLQICNGC